MVGELVGAGEAQERNVVGETPNLAARLQALAAPDTVVIAAGTRRLTGDAFELRAIEPAQLKGFDGPVVAWRVLREHTMQSRFEALRAAASRRWSAAKRSWNCCCALAAGQGRRRPRRAAVRRARHRQVAPDRALLERLAGRAPAVLRYFCLPHHQASALQPVVAQLQHAAGFSPRRYRRRPADKLEKVLAQAAASVGATMALLSRPACAGLRPAGSRAVDPQRRAAQVLAALLDQLKGLARSAARC